MLPDCWRTSHTQATCSWVNPKDWKGMRAGIGGQGRDVDGKDVMEGKWAWLGEVVKDPRWWFVEEDEVMADIWVESVMCPTNMIQLLFFS